MQNKQPLWLDVSLWSANLLNLESDIRAMEPYADGFHIDVADGHFVPTLLFFPDLVAAIRKATTKPLHVHLMATEPAELAPSFIEAGADIITVPVEIATASKAVAAINAAGRKAGLAVSLDTDVEALGSLFDGISVVVAMGTRVGIKGVDLAPEACDRIRAIRKLLDQRGLDIRVYADGGIREHTVPLLQAAGADGIVPGSLLFNASDRGRVHAWLKSL